MGQPRKVLCTRSTKYAVLEHGFTLYACLNREWWDEPCQLAFADFEFVRGRSELSQRTPQSSLSSLAVNRRVS
jgi:hypothetical protein